MKWFSLQFVARVCARNILREICVFHLQSQFLSEKQMMQNHNCRSQFFTLTNHQTTFDVIIWYYLLITTYSQEVRQMDVVGVWKLFGSHQENRKAIRWNFICRTKNKEFSQRFTFPMFREETGIKALAFDWKFTFFSLSLTNYFKKSK